MNCPDCNEPTTCENCRRDIVLEGVQLDRPDEPLIQLLADAAEVIGTYIAQMSDYDGNGRPFCRECWANDGHEKTCLVPQAESVLKRIKEMKG